MDESTGRGRRIEPWPWVLVGLLASMIAGSLGFFAIASANPDPLVVDDVWEAGNRYNATLGERERARDLGASLALTTVADGVDSVRVEVQLDPPATTAKSVSVRRERPAQGGFDQDFPLVWDGEHWSGSVPVPLRGRWQLTATARVGPTPLTKRTTWWQPNEAAR